MPKLNSNDLQSTKKSNRGKSKADKTKIHKLISRTSEDKPTAIETAVEKVDLDKGNKGKIKKGESTNGKKDQLKKDQAQPEEENTECGQLIKALTDLNTTKDKYPELIEAIKEARNNLVILKEVVQEVVNKNVEISNTAGFALEIGNNLTSDVEKLIEIYESETKPMIAQLIKDNKALTARLAKLEKKVK
jgi:hypothetical protein